MQAEEAMQARMAIIIEEFPCRGDNEVFLGRLGDLKRILDILIAVEGELCFDIYGFSTC